MKKKGLGRGLASLVSTPVPPARESGSSFLEGNAAKKIGEDNSYETDASHSAFARMVRYIPLNKIQANPNQPRKHFDERQIEELSQSIQQVGLLQPIVVRPSNSDSKGDFEIIAGERRFRAAQKLGLKDIPAIVRTLNEQEALEISIVENIQREDLSPVEEARSMARLESEFNLTHEELAKRLGKERTTVSNLLRILNLPELVLTLVDEGKVSLGHAKVLLSLRQGEAQKSLAQRVAREKISVRMLEELIERVAILDQGPAGAGTHSKSANKKASASIVSEEILSTLREKMGTKVSIKGNSAGKGKIELFYYSPQELERIIEQISKN